MKIASQSKPFTNSEPLRVTIVETYPQELQPVHPEKPDIYFQPSRNLAVTPKIGKLPKMRIGRIKADTPDPQTNVIPEVEKTSKSDTIVKRTGTHKYKTRSSTKRVNHVTTFKNSPNMFKIDAAEKKTHTHT